MGSNWRTRQERGHTIMSIQLYALLLIIARLASMAFMYMVLKRQLQLFKLPIETKLRHFRKVLFALALAIFLGNIAPLTIDILSLVASVGRPPRISTVGVIYTFSASAVAFTSSYLVWRLYRLAARDDEPITEYDKQSDDEIKSKGDGNG